MNLDTTDYSLLFLFIPKRFENQIMSRLLETVDHAMLADRFLFLGTGARHPVALGAGHHAPLFRKPGIIRSLFRWRVIFRTHQFMASLSPVCFGKLVGIAFIDHRNFPCASFDLLGRRHAQAIAVHRDFSRGRL